MDIQDINSHLCLLLIKISYAILVKEIKDIIQKLPIRKALGLDKILNKVIKAAVEVVVIPFTNATTDYF